MMVLKSIILPSSF